ncbi:hypothetical protein M9H77_11660 [Catharanthus roseus]|uniref:Uncharacterized protein n=1 Tax=Catharanthus roseus TaxID=4058 RepID=A0ACC0BF56_CATRO|nr:hypothetical protein M9H77_11660 [Catharanthus roseus]
MAINEGNILESQAIEKLIVSITRLKKRFIKGKSYYFKATIDRVENRTQPLYDACKNCSRSVIKTDRGVECRSCPETKAIPRYLLNLNVIQWRQSTKVTLFEDVASIVIGCSRIKCIDSIGKDVNKSKHFQTMVNLNMKEFKFLIKLNKIEVRNGRLQVVAEAIEHINDKLTTKLQETSTKGRKLSICQQNQRRNERRIRHIS